MSLLIGLESVATADGLNGLLDGLGHLQDRPLAGKMLNWTLRRLVVDEKTAEKARSMAGLDEFHSRFEETARGWTEGWLAEGRAEGIETGRAEAVAAQREVLRRQAALRFGDSAGLLDAPLERVASAAKLAEIGVWLMVDTIEELVAKVEAAAADDGVD